MEFITVILAVITEREYLEGQVLLVNVDNTAAISWLNKLKSKHLNGQLWVTLLVTVLLEYRITLVCTHVAGISNTIADGLSRYTQETVEDLLNKGYRQMTMPDMNFRQAIWQASSTDFSQRLTKIRESLMKLEHESYKS